LGCPCANTFVPSTVLLLHSPSELQTSTIVSRYEELSQEIRPCLLDRVAHWSRISARSQRSFSELRHWFVSSRYVGAHSFGDCAMEKRFCVVCAATFYVVPQCPNQLYCSARTCQQVRKNLWQQTA